MLKLVLRLIFGSFVIGAFVVVGVYYYLTSQAPPANKPEIFFQHGHSVSVQSVAFAPDGKRLASGSSDSSIKLWDVESGKLQGTLTGSSDFVRSVAFAPDGKRLASGSNDGSIKLWDVESGKLQGTLTGPSGSVTGSSDFVQSVAFAPDGKRLASGSRDGSIKLWDVESGKLQGTLTGPSGSVTGSSDFVWSVAFAPDGKRLASGSSDGSIKLWDVESGKLQGTLTGPSGSVTGSSGPVWSVAFAPDGKRLASGSSDGSIKLWDVESGKLQGTLTGPSGSVTGSSSPVWSVAFAPDGKRLASGSDYGSIKLWDVESGKLQGTLTGPSDFVRSVAFAPDGKRLASGSNDGSIKLWDVESGKLQGTLTGPSGSVTGPSGSVTGSSDFVWSVAFAPDGKGLASGSSDGSIKLWDVESGKLQGTLTGSSGSVWGVAFAPDGKRLASGSRDGSIKLWDVESGKLQGTLTGPSGSVTGSSDFVWSVAFAPDGKRLVSGSNDGSIKLWDVESGKLQGTLTGPSGSVTGSSSPVWSVAFTPDGKRLASGSSDGSIKLWDVESGKLQGTLTGHTGSVWSVAFTLDGKRLASGSSDGTIGGWNVAEEKPEYFAAPSAGGQYMTLYPGTIRYRSSRQRGESEPAAVRFNGKLNNAYPLHYYRNTLHIPDDMTTSAAQLSSVSISPMPVRQAWDQLSNKPLWFGAGFAVYVSFLILAAVVLRRGDPLEIAKAFLGKAYAGEIKTIGQGLLRLGDAGAVPSFGVLFNAQTGTLTPSAKIAVGRASPSKLYLIYSDQAPTTEQLTEMRGQTAAQIIPLSSRDMARALVEGTASAEILRRLEEPFVARNDPYDEQRPVESELLFFGRAGALADIPQALLQGQHVGLFGLRKVGKTSLLNRIRDRMTSNPCVWIDCQGYEAVAIDLFNAILEGLHKELTRLRVKSIPREVCVSSANEFRTVFLAHFNAWRARTASGRVVLLLDEVDKYFPDRRDEHNVGVLRSYVTLFRMLRALAQEHQCLSVMAVAYRPGINRQNFLTELVGENPMFMAYQEHFLRFLSHDDTVTMLSELGRWQDIAWEADTLSVVHDLSGGHPLLARQIASEACDRGRRKWVSQEDVEEVAREIQSRFSFHRVGQYIEESIWQMLRQEERALLSRLAMSSGLDSASLGREGEDALANLQHFGLVDVDKQGSLRLCGRLLQAWVERNGSVA